MHEVWDWHPYEDKFAVGGYIEDGAMFGGTDTGSAIIMVYDSKIDSVGPRMVSVVDLIFAPYNIDGVAVGVKAIQMQILNNGIQDDTNGGILGTYD